MQQFIAHDTVNDIAIIKTAFCYNVRYGLQVEAVSTLTEALRGFQDCQSHALASQIEQDTPSEVYLVAVDHNKGYDVVAYPDRFAKIPVAQFRYDDLYCPLKGCKSVRLNDQTVNAEWI